MTIIDPSTVPARIEGAAFQHGPTQASRTAVDATPERARRVVAPSPVKPPSPDELPTGNEDVFSTLAIQRPRQRAAIPGEPVVVPRTNSGRKSLMALMHWEGVVERVEGNDFHARLTPFEGGVPNPARVEFTDFTLDDLANLSDRAFVREGARFYWTLGRATNPAGTLTNVSLVRFRRLPPASPLKRKLAEAEADALLEYGLEP
jgi:hypothetical protein